MSAILLVSHVINSCALTGEKPCIHKAIHALLMHGYAMVRAYFKIRISTYYPIYLVPTTVLLGGYYDVIGLCALECTVVIYLIVLNCYA